MDFCREHSLESEHPFEKLSVAVRYTQQALPRPWWLAILPRYTQGSPPSKLYPELANFKG